MIPLETATEWFFQHDTPRILDTLSGISSLLAEAMDSHRHDFSTSKVRLQIFNSYPTRMKWFMKFNTAVLNHGGIQILSRQYPRWCKKLTIFQSSTFNIHHFLPTELPWTNYISFLLLCLLPVFMSRPWASLEFGMMPTTLNQSRGKFLHLCHSWRQWGLKHSIPILITIWFSC